MKSHRTMYEAKHFRQLKSVSFSNYKEYNLHINSWSRSVRWVDQHNVAKHSIISKAVLNGSRRQDIQFTRLSGGSHSHQKNQLHIFAAFTAIPSGVFIMYFLIVRTFPNRLSYSISVQLFHHFNKCCVSHHDDRCNTARFLPITLCFAGEFNNNGFPIFSA
jgi:hypothetical protein